MNLNIFFWIRTLLVATICSVYGYSFLGSEQPPNTGDGIVHYFISQASWSDPILFFHHWGKPFFTLISSPFSQFGYGGIVIFNCLVFSGITLFGWKILDHFKVNKSFSLLFPVLLFSIPDVYETTLSGLTEPFFNLILIAAFYFLIKNKYRSFSILVSILPFCRSEGQLVLVLAIAVLAIIKEFKAIPFLLSGFLIYAFLGAVFLGDFFWYFNLSPYEMNNDIYGSGTWTHYLSEFDQYLGTPGLIVAGLGIISSLILLIQKQLSKTQVLLILFGASTFIGVQIGRAHV